MSLINETKKKKKHISKKTRSGWKKVNIGDVEEFLENKRLEERIG